MRGDDSNLSAVRMGRLSSEALHLGRDSLHPVRTRIKGIGLHRLSLILITISVLLNFSEERAGPGAQHESETFEIGGSGRGGTADPGVMNRAL